MLRFNYIVENGFSWVMFNNLVVSRDVLPVQHEGTDPLGFYAAHNCEILNAVYSVGCGILSGSELHLTQHTDTATNHAGYIVNDNPLVTTEVFKAFYNLPQDMVLGRVANHDITPYVQCVHDMGIDYDKDVSGNIFSLGKYGELCYGELGCSKRATKNIYSILGLPLDAKLDENNINAFNNYLRTINYYIRSNTFIINMEHNYISHNGINIDIDILRKLLGLHKTPFTEYSKQHSIRLMREALTKLNQRISRSFLEII